MAGDAIADLLGHVFSCEEVIVQWNICRDSRDLFKSRRSGQGPPVYCPRLDYAVGPFNIDNESWERNREKIYKTAGRYRKQIDVLRSRDTWLGGLGKNENPRCLLAVEVEDKTSTKHRMGSIMNASALGMVGIVVGHGDSAYKSLMRIRTYMHFVESVKKAPIDPRNVIILKDNDFHATLDELTAQRHCWHDTRTETGRT